MKKDKQKIYNDDDDTQEQSTSKEVLKRTVVSDSDSQIDGRSFNLPFLKPGTTLFVSRKERKGQVSFRLIILFMIVAFLFGACVIPTTFKYIVAIRCIWFIVLIIDLLLIFIYSPAKIGLLLSHTGRMEQIQDDTNGRINRRDISFHIMPCHQQRYYRVYISANGAFRGHDFDTVLEVDPVLVTALMRKYVTADKILAFGKHYCSVTGVYLHSHDELQLESDSIQLAAMLAEYDRIRCPLLDFSKPLY